ncbi:hypothetical protein [Mesonia oceanica]|uniref:Uncharacterized protein n=2 Tax=Mesonia TaxID=232115 RepID=A0AC61Y5T1_9FLAO|nr:hypothetical protein [Mesonia oceanica]VVU99846.1 hypothetical protein FVB9532_01107 [Mesonia oceanica]
MKKIKKLFQFFGIVLVAIVVIFIIPDIINDDLYGRLIETKDYYDKEQNDSLPTVTIVLKEYIEEKNSIESSVIINYYQSYTFSYYNKKKLKFKTSLTDRFNYDPMIRNFTAIDSINRYNSGYLYSSFESENFLIPASTSLYGFPNDEIIIYPNITLEVNENSSHFKFKIQKRISGRILEFTDGNSKMIKLSRTLTEKMLVYISSAIFLILTFIITYSLIRRKKRLNSVEELIMVAGYLLAIAGFREILGISRQFGTSSLEIIVILVPLIVLTIGIGYSYFKGRD